MPDMHASKDCALHDCIPIQLNKRSQFTATPHDHHAADLPSQDNVALQSHVLTSVGLAKVSCTITLALALC